MDIGKHILRTLQGHGIDTGRPGPTALIIPQDVNNADAPALPAPVDGSYTARYSALRTAPPPRTCAVADDGGFGDSAGELPKLRDEGLVVNCVLPNNGSLGAPPGAARWSRWCATWSTPQRWTDSPTRSGRGRTCLTSTRQASRCASPPPSWRSRSGTGCRRLISRRPFD